MDARAALTESPKDQRLFFCLLILVLFLSYPLHLEEWDRLFCKRRIVSAQLAWLKQSWAEHKLNLSDSGSRNKNVQAAEWNRSKILPLAMISCRHKTYKATKTSGRTSGPRFCLQFDPDFARDLSAGQTRDN